MSALLEYECQVPRDGYEVITIEVPVPKDEDDASSRVIIEKWRVLQPRSERTRHFDLFKVSSCAFLEFAQMPATEDGIKDFADRYGPLEPDKVKRRRTLVERLTVGDLLEFDGESFDLALGDNAQLLEPETERRPFGRDIDWWSTRIRDMHRAVELWEMSKSTGNFSKIIRRVQKNFMHPDGASVQLLLKEDPSSASARLCIRPHSLLHALWAQLVLAIDGKLNLRACVQCRKWFTLEAGRGRSDKEYCSNACRMRAYRKRKGSG